MRWLFFVVAGWAVGGCASVDAERGQLSISWVDAPVSVSPVDLSLRSGDGLLYTGEQLRDQVTLAIFGFTSCPDVCPMTLQGLAPALDDLAADGVPAQGLFIAVDPARDEPGLRDYVAHFSPRIVGVTGDGVALAQAADHLGGSFRVWDDGGETRVEHATSAFVIGPDGRVAGYVVHPSNTGAVYQDVIRWWRGSFGAVELSEAWVRSPLPGSTVTAGYGVLTNRADEEVHIRGVQSAFADVQLHETYTHDGVTGMRPVQPRLGSGETLRLEPGALHFMISGLASDATALSMRLILDDGQSVPLQLPVRP